MDILRRGLAWAKKHGVIGLVLTVAMALGFRSAIADWNDVPTGSMKPTILVGDRIFVNKLAYDLKLPFTHLRLVTWGGPARGDIVTCWSPADGKRLVKRVVGVPGDVIQMRRSRLIVNGDEVAYAAADSAGLASVWGDGAGGQIFFTERLPDHPHIVAYTPARRAIRDFGPVTVPAGSYFMMGDNRDNSADSRYFGFVSRQAVIGRVQGTVWSFDLRHHLRPRWHRFLSGLV